MLVCPLQCLFCCERARHKHPRKMWSVSPLVIGVWHTRSPLPIHESVDPDRSVNRCHKICAVFVRQNLVTRNPRFVPHSSRSHLSQTSYFIRQSAMSIKCPTEHLYLRRMSSCLRCLQVAHTLRSVCFKSLCLVTNPSASISLLIRNLLYPL